jgi:hypothetical protein
MAREYDVLNAKGCTQAESNPQGGSEPARTNRAVLQHVDGLGRPGAQPVGAFDPAYCPGHLILPNR